MRMFKIEAAYPDGSIEPVGYAHSYEDGQTLISTLFGLPGPFEDVQHFITQECEMPRGYLIWGTTPGGLEYIIGAPYLSKTAALEDMRWLVDKGVPEWALSIQNNCEGIFDA